MTEFDGPWKEALEELFEPFMALLFPQAHAGIDWSRGYEFLDKELQALAIGGENGPLFVDKLVRVWITDGSEQWVLIHVEVQSQPEAGFERRMFTYHVRIYDHHDGRPVVSLAVLGDDQPAWRPGRFGYNLWGCSVEFRFPTVKLLDLAGDVERLENDPNPFAAVVLAHLEALRTRRDDDARAVSKRRVAVSLYRRGWDAAKVRRVFRFIDWLMRLPAELDTKFWRAMQAFEQEQQMPFVTIAERYGREVGEAEGRLKGLERAVELNLTAKFGDDGRELLPRVRAVFNEGLLQALLTTIPTAVHLDEVRAVIATHEHKDVAGGAAR